MSNWIAKIRELNAIAKTGLFYAKDVYDRQRYEQLLLLSNEMMAEILDEPVALIDKIYKDENGYQTPKIDTRGVVWKGDQLLLVQENDGLWTLPGGWMDVNETLSSNVQKEIREEAGCQVEVNRVIALLDRNRHNPGQNIFSIVKVFIECEFIEGDFEKNPETQARGFFTQEKLPPLMENKSSYEQIAMCFEARKKGSTWTIPFD